MFLPISQILFPLKPFGPLTTYMEEIPVMRKLTPRRIHQSPIQQGRGAPYFSLDPQKANLEFNIWLLLATALNTDTFQ